MKPLESNPNIMQYSGPRKLVDGECRANGSAKILIKERASNQYVHYCFIGKKYGSEHIEFIGDRCDDEDGIFTRFPNEIDTDSFMDDIDKYINGISKMLNRPSCGRRFP
jgi:hypothetical protein